MKQKNKDYVSDEVIKSPHRKRENLSARKKDRFEEGMKLWTSFFRLI